jgi:hypothetical protein
MAVIQFLAPLQATVVAVEIISPTLEKTEVQAVAVLEAVLGQRQAQEIPLALHHHKVIMAVLALILPQIMGQAVVAAQQQ